MDKKEFDTIYFGYIQADFATFITEAANRTGFSVWVTECDRPNRIQVWSGSGDVDHTLFWREFDRLRSEAGWRLNALRNWEISTLGDVPESEAQ